VRFRCRNKGLVAARPQEPCSGERFPSCFLSYACHIPDGTPRNGSGRSPALGPFSSRNENRLQQRYGVNRTGRTLTNDFRRSNNLSGLGFKRLVDIEGGHRFDPCRAHHPVSANRAFPARRQIGRFCGHFRRLNSRILVSVGVRAFWWRLLAPCLCIQKFRSRRPWLSAKSERG
jgi:hypothetical protein